MIRQGPTKHFVAAEKRIVPDEPYHACKIISVDLRGGGGLQKIARIGTLIGSMQVVDRRSVRGSTATSLTFEFKKETMHQQITQRRTIPLFLLFTACFSLSVLPAAEEPQEQSSHETLWRQTQGEWIRFKPDRPSGNPYPATLKCHTTSGTQVDRRGIQLTFLLKDTSC